MQILLMIFQKLNVIQDQLILIYKLTYSVPRQLQVAETKTKT